MKDFGKKLKVARQETEMSQRSLGLALGLSDKTISSYESSRSYPNLEVLCKISEILEKPIEYFISSNKEVKISEILKSIDRKQSEIIDDIKVIRDMLK